MISYFKKFVVVLSVFLFYAFNTYSAENKINSAKLPFTNEHLRDEIIHKNNFIGQNVDPKYYLHNVVIIKLKNDTEINFLAKKQFGNYFNQIIKTDMINMIEAPFKKYFPTKLQAKDKRGLGRIYEIKFNNDIDPYQLSKDLMSNPNIEYATPVFKRVISSYTPNDPLLGKQYAMKLMQMEEAWEISKGDSNIVIALVDSGTDINHEDLTANIWTNPNEIPDNGIDDDNNGKIDDVHGWDFIGNVSVNDYYDGNWAEDNNPINTGNDHGTFTAGCASAVTNNSIGISGTGFKCKIMPLKCAADNPALGSGILRGYEAILFAAQNGADIINCSWGGPGGSPAEQDIINTANDLGSVVVVAAGNSNLFVDEFKEYPAAYENVISVGASNSTDSPSQFSNYGNTVTVFAPGEGIESTKLNNKYALEDGTSFSSPIVSGIVGLLKSIHKDWTPKQFLRQIRSTSDRNMKNTTGYEAYFIGRVNAYRALTYNNPNFPDKVMPGIYGENLQVINPTNKLDNFDKNTISIDIKNYLGKANDLKITITPIDKFIENTTTEIILSKPLNTFDTAKIEIEVQLLPNTPWYQGNAQLLLKYESGKYIDYQVINIPIFLPTENRFDQRTTYPYDSGLSFFGGSMPDKNTVWLIGYSEKFGSLLYKNAETEYDQVIANEPIYCIHAFDGLNAIAAASPTSKLSKIYTTNNGGFSWDTKSINKITPFVNSIHFYNNQEGILLGDPISNAWGNAKTNDGGNTWIPINNMPLPLANESGFVESVAYLDNNIWFGTSQGRIYYSKDRGENWNVSSSVLGSSLSKMTFMNDLTGFAIYTVGTGQNTQQLLGTTLDGGKTWTLGIYEFTKNSITPAEIHSVPDAGKVIILTSDNRVFESADLGTSWQPVLTKKMYGVNHGIAFNDGIGVRLWSAGTIGIGYLDFKLKPVTASKRISIVSDNPVNLGNININSSKIIKVEIRNSGNVDLNIESYELVLGNGVDAAEIRLLSQPALSLKPLESTIFNVSFRPTSKGVKTAVINIKSDAIPSQLIINLTGNGNENTSVEENNINTQLIKISPQPVKDLLNIKYLSDFNGESIINIYDLSGNKLIEFPKYLNEGINIFSVDLKNIIEGTYILTIKNKLNFETMKFVK